MDILHPAYHEDVTRGQPSQATVGTTTYPIDDGGYLSIEDEADAVAAMDRLASTYGVTYTDDGEIETDSTPNTPGSSGEDTAPEDDADGDTDDTAPDDGEQLAQAAADADKLQSMDRDELRERCRNNDAVDVEAINLNQTDEMVAALMRAQADGVSEGGGA